MRILQVFNQYLRRGGEEVWVDKLPELLGDAFEVRELRFRSSEWSGPGSPSKFRQIRWIGDNPHSRRRLRGAVEQYRPDVLLFHNLVPVASLGLYDEALNLGLPVVQYIHNFRPFSPSGALWARGRVNDAALHGNPWPEIVAGAWGGSRVKTAVLAYHQWRLHRSGALDAVKVWIAISEFVRVKFLEARLPAKRLALLPHCWENGTGEVSAAEGDYYLFLGRLCTEKGLEPLLDAWDRQQNRTGCPRLVIAGEGPLEKQVRQAAARNPRIEFLGFVQGDRKASLLAACRALIAPSVWWEPLGLIVYEAYAAARPVLAARGGGLVETVSEAKTGFLHQPGVVEALADDVDRMEALGKEGRALMGRAGHRWLLDHASTDEWRKKFSAIVDRAVGQSHVPVPSMHSHGRPAH